MRWLTFDWRDTRDESWQRCGMSTSSNVVTIHPYFKVNPGRMDEAKALLPQFVEKTRSESGCLYYEFTIHEDVVFCREGYAGGEAALLHVQSVGELIGKLLQFSELARLEIHGPAVELEKMKGPLAELNPTWFALECGK